MFYSIVLIINRKQNFLTFFSEQTLHHHQHYGKIWASFEVKSDRQRRYSFNADIKWNYQDNFKGKLSWISSSAAGYEAMKNKKIRAK